MLREILLGKIHRAKVTEADLNYVGSITIDEKLMEASGMVEYQLVRVWDIDNGERFETYTLKGERGSGIVCLNGAAARKVAVGDRVIIAAFGMLSENELKEHRPRIVIVDGENKIVDTFGAL